MNRPSVVRAPLGYRDRQARVNPVREKKGSAFGKRTGYVIGRTTTLCVPPLHPSLQLQFTTENMEPTERKKKPRRRVKRGERVVLLSSALSALRGSICLLFSVLAVFSVVKSLHFAAVNHGSTSTWISPYMMPAMKAAQG